MNELIINGSVCGCKSYDSVMSSTQWIKNDLQDMSKSFCKLGFHLWELKHYGFGVNENIKNTYMESDFYEYVNEVFGISKTTCNNLIRVCKLFSHGNTMHIYLDEKYQAYTLSQLVEMASLDSNLLKQVNPNMTVKEIRNLKKRDVIDVVEKPDVGSDVPLLKKREFKQVYSLKSSSDLEADLMICLTSAIKNVDKVKNIISLLENYWQKYGV